MNYETLTDAQLASELLGTDIATLPQAAPRVREPAQRGIQTMSQSQLLRHRLGAAKELIQRELRNRLPGTPVMSSPVALREWLRLSCAGLQHEEFFGVFLDAQLRLIACETLFRGTLTQTSVYPREVVKAALAHNAAAMAVAHNHPSGDTDPSRADEFLTQTLKSALALVDVRLIDHFIVGGDQVISMAECGRL